MLGDLLVDREYALDSNGNLITDPDTGGYKTVKNVNVYPIHPDDEIILFQRVGSDAVYKSGNEVEKITNDGCKCCYGKTKLYPTRTRTVRQKYKNIGCAWTWYPPKYAVNGDPNIPQCSAFSLLDPRFDFSVSHLSNCYYQKIYGTDYSTDNIETRPNKCDSCTQILPWVAEAHENDFNIWGDVITSPIRVPGGPNDEAMTGRAWLPIGGWLTQYTSFLYPSHNIKDMTPCCTCYEDPKNTSPVRLVDPTVSCWNKVANGNESASDCEWMDQYATTVLNHTPMLTTRIIETRIAAQGDVFYSPLQGRTNSQKTSTILGSDNTFNMGVNVPKLGGTAFFVNFDLIDTLYKPSSGGFRQNYCNYCAMSPYMRRLMLTSYPWAFDVFCAGGGDVSSPVKTYDLGVSYITTGLGDYGLYDYEQLHRENFGIAQTPDTSNYTFKMEQYTPMLGESTFFSQFVGTVHLEHYFHYMGTNLDDVNAAGPTIPPQTGFGGTGTNGSSANPKDRWGYWLTRTTPKIFTYKSSGTPLFQFDLEYAKRLGIFEAFADPDQSQGSIPMTVEKFLSYFSMFSNSISDNGLPDGRGKGMFPPGCSSDGHKYVQIVRDILGAMCEAGIIGTRDHRENIYNEIKQIIETGMANGPSGAYYLPWEPGYPVPVPPSDFISLKQKYYDAYGRMCTPAEMFPESGIDGLAQFAPIRKVIPPNYLQWGDPSGQGQYGWYGDGKTVPYGGLILYKENTVNPDKIFKEHETGFYNCITGEIDPSVGSGFPSEYKIQDLQYSKYYNTDKQYSKNAPGYVNRQLFFRAIPGTWNLVKWGSLCLNIDDCEYCSGDSTGCSPFNIYGYGPDITFHPENMWYAPNVLIKYSPKESNFDNGILTLCSGINLNQDLESTKCSDNGYSVGGDSDPTNPNNVECGYQGICWDPSGAPSSVRCVEDCSIPSNSICKGQFCCGARCSASCAPAVNFLFDPNTTGIDNKLCKDLFGITCCQCIGKSPNDKITSQEWSNILFGPSKKCNECGDACFVKCPESPEAFREFGATNPEPKNNFITNPCDICECGAKSCPVLGVGSCDFNCGYNGFEYHPLAVVCSTSSYGWGKQHTVENVSCTICQCSGNNYCYARFGGKVQKYQENLNTHFYSPQEDPNGNLYYTENIINVPAPLHVLTPDTPMGKTVQTIAECQSSCGVPDPGSNPYAWCICQTPTSVGEILCPGALMAGFLNKVGNDGTCTSNPFWCKISKSGRIKLPHIIDTDIDPAIYEY
jgi:hypothetical protein